jgi:hypothetical protein
VVVSIDGGHVDEGFLRDAFDTFKADTTAHDAELVVTTDHDGFLDGVKVGDPALTGAGQPHDLKESGLEPS